MSEKRDLAVVTGPMRGIGLAARAWWAPGISVILIDGGAAETADAAAQASGERVAVDTVVVDLADLDAGGVVRATLRRRDRTHLLLGQQRGSGSGQGSGGRSLDHISARDDRGTVPQRRSGDGRAPNWG